jgi:hypothetical protein
MNQVSKLRTIPGDANNLCQKPESFFLQPNGPRKYASPTNHTPKYQILPENAFEDTRASTTQTSLGLWQWQCACVRVHCASPHRVRYSHTQQRHFTHNKRPAPKNVRQKQKNIIPTGNFLSFFDFHRQPVWPYEQKELAWLEIFGWFVFCVCWWCLCVRVLLGCSLGPNFGEFRVCISSLFVCSGVEVLCSLRLEDDNYQKYSGIKYI